MNTALMEKFSDENIKLWEKLYDDQEHYDFRYHDTFVCPHCPSRKLFIEHLTEEDGSKQIRMVCEDHLDGQHPNKTYFKYGQKCKKCPCLWTCHINTKQIRKADEGSTEFIACIEGHKYPITG